MIANTHPQGKDERPDENETKPLITINSNVTLQDPLSINGSEPILDQPSFLHSGYPNYKYVRPETGIALMLTISFLSSMSSSLALPSLWPYTETLKGAISDLGWAVALHSAGTVLLAPLLIAWTNRRSIREVLIGSLLIMAGGGVLHGMSTHIYMLLIARFIIGAGSANYVITTIYLSQVSRRTRDRALYLNGIVSVVGFALGPGITACFTPFDRMNLQWKIIKINSQTVPGYFLTVLALGAALWTMFVSLRALSKKVKIARPHPESYNPDNSYPIYNNSAASYDITGSMLNYGVAGSSGYFYTESNDDVPTMLKELWNNRQKLPLIPLFVCLIAYFLIILAFTVWETLGAYLTEYQLSWRVRTTGIMFTGIGVVSGFTLLLLKLLTRMLAARLILPVGALFMAVGAAIMCAIGAKWTLTFLIAGVGLIAVGYTVSVTTVMHVYGCVLELSMDFPPSAVGWLSTCGSVARVVGPVIAAYLMQGKKTDPFALMIYAAAIPFGVVLISVISYRRLPP